MTTPYATRQDLRRYLPGVVLDAHADAATPGFDYPGITADEQDAALLDASALIDDALSEAVDLPYPPGRVPPTLRIYCCWIAAYLLLTSKGFSSEAADKLLVKRYDDAMKALAAVADGANLVADPVDPAPPLSAVAATAVYAPATPWQDAARGPGCDPFGSGGGASGF